MSIKYHEELKMATIKKLKINSDFIPGYKKDAVVCVDVDSGVVG